MNILDALENYSQLCDELEGVMQAENRTLRATRSPAFFSERKEADSARLSEALSMLRNAAPAERAQQPSVRATHARAVQKLLKLLMLSRESEQLLLESLSPSRRLPAARPNAALLRNAYGSH